MSCAPATSRRLRRIAGQAEVLRRIAVSSSTDSQAQSLLDAATIEILELIDGHIALLADQLESTHRYIIPGDKQVGATDPRAGHPRGRHR